MTEELPAPIYLTVGRLIDDLKEFDLNSEVAVVLHRGGLSIPINNLMRLTTDERTLALLIVNEENVQKAIELNNKAGEIVN